MRSTSEGDRQVEAPVSARAGPGACFGRRGIAPRDGRQGTGESVGTEGAPCPLDPE